MCLVCMYAGMYVYIHTHTQRQMKSGRFPLRLMQKVDIHEKHLYWKSWRDETMSPHSWCTRCDSHNLHIEPWVWTNEGKCCLIAPHCTISSATITCSPSLDHLNENYCNLCDNSDTRLRAVLTQPPPHHQQQQQHLQLNAVT
jgi:hypothetical protein